MEKEIWLQKLKEQLEDYSEQVPTSGWQRLEKELSAPKKTEYRLTPMRRWITTIAAAILTGTIILVGLRLTGPSSTTQIPVADLTPEKVSSSDIFSPPASPAKQVTDEPIATNHSRKPVLQKDSHNMQAIEVISVEKTNDVPPLVAENAEKKEDAKDLATPTTENQNKDASKKRKKKNSLPATREDLLALAKTSHSSDNNKGWSIGVSAGNTGGFSKGIQQPEIQSILQNAPGTGYINMDLSATSDGIIYIPKGQEVIFQNGVPYLQQNKRTLLSADHKQPVSVGVSFRKNLPKGFSIETGLVYTFLASDLYYQGDVEKTKQKLHYLGIPIRGNWNYLDKKNFTLYLSAGGMMEKCIYGKIGSKTEIVDPIQLSVMASTGIQYNISHRVGIYVEPGISYYFDDGSEIQTIRKENPFNFTLQAGLRFSY